MLLRFLWTEVLSPKRRKLKETGLPGKVWCLKPTCCNYSLSEFYLGKNLVMPYLCDTEVSQRVAAALSIRLVLSFACYIGK